MTESTQRGVLAPAHVQADGRRTTWSVDDWLARLVADAPNTPEIDLPIGAAFGHVLADDVTAAHALPLWSNSAMDGYAIRAADAAGDAATALRIIGEVAAGSSADPVIEAGEAVRIMTGAPVPSSADAVVPVEETSGDDRGAGEWGESTVRVLAPVRIGANVRAAGEDVGAGAVIAQHGWRLTAAGVSALAAAGIAAVRVHRRPRVAVVATGSELLPPGSALERGQIPESNSLLIAGMLREAGIEPVAVRHSRDDAAGLAQMLAQLGDTCDAIVTTGGVGPGTHDIVRIALEPEPDVIGVRVAMKPGQLQRAGRLAGGALVFALPGNPVSAAVSFELFVRPTLLAMQGAARIHRHRVQARAATGWRGAAGRLQVLPVILGEDDGMLTCAPAVHARRVSHSVGGYGASDAYAIVEAGRGDVAPGECVSVIQVGA
ncbi:molybdopterin molybdotransferase MoeA [Leucobacter tardus]|uniref:Molybdopterin molybdenumtransferase n=1 Tax=Leucobacter tardus TaxID=501483 RepID=A0A939QGM3_9MICO|nr:gephyrin-like molybdotransferase Glp [Leucobacter tardus]MBO2990873.1 molybdopterin molybdotransferase MoeA [Leucobacter tardus]